MRDKFILNVWNDGSLVLYMEKKTDDGIKYDEFLFTWDSWEHFMEFVERYLIAEYFDAVESLHIRSTK